MNEKRAYEIASERLKAITPFLEGRPCDDRSGASADGLQEKPRWSRRTLRRWLSAYARRGFEGLKPKPRTAAAPKSIDSRVLEKLRALRLQNPWRSVQSLIELVEMTGEIGKGTLARSTLQRWFQRMALDRTTLRHLANSTAVAGRFQHPNRNCLWQADIIYGPRIAGKRTYGVVIEDDCTRFAVHAEFYHRQTRLTVEDSVRKALVKFGVPEAVYCDHGKQFDNPDLKLALAKLGSRIRLAPVRSPKSKGKVERLNQNIHKFFKEFNLLDSKNQSLESLNEYFWAWLDTWYLDRPHRALKDGVTPRRAFMTDKKPLIMKTEGEIAAAFMASDVRRVDPSGCVSANGRIYAIPGGQAYDGRDVNVKYDRLNPAEILVLLSGPEPVKARELVITDRVGERPKLGPVKGLVGPAGSEFLEQAALRRDRRLGRPEPGSGGPDGDDGAGG